jgi:hypothetical protein
LKKAEVRIPSGTVGKAEGRRELDGDSDPTQLQTTEIQNECGGLKPFLAESTDGLTARENPQANLMPSALCIDAFPQSGSPKTDKTRLYPPNLGNY